MRTSLPCYDAALLPGQLQSVTLSADDRFEVYALTLR